MVSVYDASKLFCPPKVMEMEWLDKILGVDEETKEFDLMVYGNHYRYKLFGLIWIRLDPKDVSFSFNNEGITDIHCGKTPLEIFVDGLRRVRI